MINLSEGLTLLQSINRVFYSLSALNKYKNAFLSINRTAPRGTGEMPQALRNRLLIPDIWAVLASGLLTLEESH